MGLSRRDLGHDEEVILELRSHRGALVIPILFLMLCVAGAIAVLVDAHGISALGRKVGAGLILALGTLVFLSKWWKWRSRTVALTTQRVVVVNGALSKVTEQVRLGRIVEVHHIQSILDRVLSRGSVVLEVDDGPALVVDRLRKPEAFQRVVVRQLGGGGIEEGDDALFYETPDVIDQRGRRRARQIQIVTEDDATPPMGTPAVSGSRAATLFARLDELDRLEASGALSPREAALRRSQLTGPI